MEYINGLPIDGKTEIDDLALVMHIAQVCYVSNVA